MRRLGPGRRKGERINYLLAKNRRRLRGGREKQERAAAGRGQGCGRFISRCKKDAHRGDAVCLRVTFYNGAGTGRRIVAAVPTSEFLRTPATALRGLRGVPLGRPICVRVPVGGDPSRLAGAINARGRSLLQSRKKRSRVYQKQSFAA